MLNILMLQLTLEMSLNKNKLLNVEHFAATINIGNVIYIK
jgi:hypothetical protein